MISVRRTALIGTLLVSYIAVCLAPLVPAAGAQDAPQLSPTAAKYGFIGVVSEDVSVNSEFHVSVPQPMRFDSVVQPNASSIAVILGTLKSMSGGDHYLTVAISTLDGKTLATSYTHSAVGPSASEAEKKLKTFLDTHTERTPAVGFSSFATVLSLGENAGPIRQGGQFRALVYWDDEKLPVLVVPFTVGPYPTPAGSDEATRSEVLRSIKAALSARDRAPLVALVGKGEASVPGLAAALKDSDAGTRLAALVVLAALGPKASGAANEITAALTDPDRNVRTQAFRTAGSLGMLMAMEPFASRLVQFVLKTSKRELEPQAMVALARMLIPRLIDELHGTESFLTGAWFPAAQSLSLLGPAAVPALVEALQYGSDSHGFAPRSFDAFTLALIQTKDPAAIKALHDVYNNPRESDSTRCLVGAVLGTLDTAPADEVSLMAKVLSDSKAKTDTEAYYAVRLLPASSRPAVLPYIRKLAALENPAGNWSQVLTEIEKQ